MIRNYRKRRSDWLEEPDNISKGMVGQFSYDELRRREEQSNRSEEMLRKYWQIHGYTLTSNKFETYKAIDLDTYQDRNTDEIDVVVIPKNRSIQPIKITDSPRNSDSHNTVVLDQNPDESIISEEQQQEQEQAQKIAKNNNNKIINSNNNNIQNIKQTSNFATTATSGDNPLIANGGSCSDSLNTSLNESFIQKAIEARLDQIRISKAITANNPQPQLLNASQQLQKSQFLNPQDQWYPLRHGGQVPLSFYSDWKCKAIDKVNLDFGAEYKPHEIFHQLFTPQLYALIAQATYQKQKKHIFKENRQEDDQPVQFNPYEIDAFIALIFHFHCLDRPNNINLMLNDQLLMEKDQLEKLLRYFSLGNKEQSSQFGDQQIKNSQSGGLGDVLDQVNESFKKFIEPKEFLVLQSKPLHGQDMLKNATFCLKESRLTDASLKYILDLQLNKIQMKDDVFGNENVLISQGNMLENYRGLGYKVILSSNDGFEIEEIKSLRKQAIGIITKLPIQSLCLNPNQIQEIEQNSTIPHFFIQNTELAALVTEQSYKQVPKSLAYISNFIALSSGKDLEDPKIERMYNELSETDSFKEIRMRNSTGIKWQLLSFVRILEAVVHNTMTLFNITAAKGNSLQKEQIMQQLQEYFAQKYKGHKSLQAKLLTSQIQSKDIRLHFCREMQGNKRIECLICGNKTKNYCLQCSEKDQMQVGFCGSPQCNEKHNAIPAMLLNEQANDAHAYPQGSQMQKQSKLNLDKPYESCSEGLKNTNFLGQSFKNKRNDGYSSSETNRNFKFRGPNQEASNGIIGSLSSIQTKGTAGKLQQYKEPPNMSFGEMLVLKKQNKLGAAGGGNNNSQSLSNLTPSNLDKEFNSLPEEDGFSNINKDKQFTVIKGLSQSNKDPYYDNTPINDQRRLQSQMRINNNNEETYNTTEMVLEKVKNYEKISNNNKNDGQNRKNNRSEQQDDMYVKKDKSRERERSETNRSEGQNKYEVKKPYSILERSQSFLDESNEQMNGLTGNNVIGASNNVISTANRRNSPNGLTAVTTNEKIDKLPDSRTNKLNQNNQDQKTNRKFTTGTGNDEVDNDGNSSMNNNKKKKKFAFDTPQEEVFALLLEKKKKQSQQSQESGDVKEEFMNSQHNNNNTNGSHSDDLASFKKPLKKHSEQSSKGFGINNKGITTVSEGIKQELEFPKESQNVCLITSQKDSLGLNSQQQMTDSQELFSSAPQTKKVHSPKDTGQSIQQITNSLEIIETKLQSLNNNNKINNRIEKHTIEGQQTKQESSFVSEFPLSEKNNNNKGNNNNTSNLNASLGQENNLSQNKQSRNVIKSFFPSKA